MATDVTNTDNYKALPSGAGSLQEAVDTALAAIVAAYAKNVADGTTYEDNLYAVFKEQIEQQEVA